jgi:hypothetical protein
MKRPCGKAKGGDIMAAIRRREIERYARTIEVADTDDFSTVLIAWQWHNAGSKDPIGALILAAQRMGGCIIGQEADLIIREAATTRQCRKADTLGRYLRLTDSMRSALGIRTIGSIDVSKEQRAARRKEQKRRDKENRRRAQGIQSRTEYLSNSLARTKPWEKEHISRQTWYRRRKAAADPINPSNKKFKKLPALGSLRVAMAQLRTQSSLPLIELDKSGPNHAAPDCPRTCTTQQAERKKAVRSRHRTHKATKPLH